MAGPELSELVRMRTRRNNLATVELWVTIATMLRWRLTGKTDNVEAISLHDLAGALAALS